MTETQPAAPEAAAPQGTAKPAEPPQGTPAAEQPKTEPQGPDWKQMARKWERQAKDDAAQLAAIRTALGEKETEASALQTAKAQAELAALRYRIAYENGLPPALADRLTGDDEEQIRADAAALAELVKPKPARANPAEGTGTTAPEKHDTNELLRKMAGY